MIVENLPKIDSIDFPKFEMPIYNDGLSAHYAIVAFLFKPSPKRYDIGYDDSELRTNCVDTLLAKACFTINTDY